MPGLPNHTIFPISDTALTIDFGNVISEAINASVLALFYALKATPFPGMIEAVPAYSSLSVYYDPFLLRRQVAAGQTVYDWVVEQVNTRIHSHDSSHLAPSREVTIPVCYEGEYASDIQLVAKKKNITVDEVIAIHTSRVYRVYMLGFLPGFSYLGEVDDRIALSRKSRPATVVEGSIGIAGKQTGIYPMTCPGGWQIIGRTPLKLFRIETGSTELCGKPDDDLVCLLHPGDHVRFTSISANEFKNY